jgi:hypothetical protein
MKYYLQPLSGEVVGPFDGEAAAELCGMLMLVFGYSTGYEVTAEPDFAELFKGGVN